MRSRSWTSVRSIKTHHKDTKSTKKNAVLLCALCVFVVSSSILHAEFARLVQLHLAVVHDGVLEVGLLRRRGAVAALGVQRDERHPRRVHAAPHRHLVDLSH